MLAHYDQTIGEMRNLIKDGTLIMNPARAKLYEVSSPRALQLAEHRQDVTTATPPKMPYSCCMQTRSFPLKFRNSAARSYEVRSS